MPTGGTSAIVDKQRKEKDLLKAQRAILVQKIYRDYRQSASGPDSEAHGTVRRRPWLWRYPIHHRLCVNHEVVRLLIVVPKDKNVLKRKEVTVRCPGQVFVER